MKKVKFLMTMKDADYVNNILSSCFVEDSEDEFHDAKKLRQLDKITDNLQNAINRAVRD